MGQGRQNSQGGKKARVPELFNGAIRLAPTPEISSGGMPLPVDAVYVAYLRRLATEDPDHPKGKKQGLVSGDLFSRK